MSTTTTSQVSTIAGGQDINTTTFLPTNTAYIGQWDLSRKIFLGYGIYCYPNGCEYSGSFYKGKFNGYGTIQFPPPVGLSVSGIFENGKLKMLYSMCFHDGLFVNMKLGSSGLSFDKWTYCTVGDRRYCVEHKQGMMAVGPEVYLTANDPPKDLEEDTFDAGDGIYFDDKHLLSNGRYPLPYSRNIWLPEEKQWILDNCRQKNAEENYMPNEYIAEQIITANLLSDDGWQNYQNKCRCSTKEYFAKLCQDPEKSSSEISMDTTLSDNLSDSSSMQMIYKHYNHLRRAKSVAESFYNAEYSGKESESVR